MKYPLALLLFTPALAQSSSDWKPKSPPAKVSTDEFQTMGDLEVTVWATTPQLYNPTNMDIDHAGRIWVAEGVNYRRHLGRRPAGDRIAVLEDTDGDGKCDTSHTFVEEKGLIAPLGVAVFDNEIYVSMPPDLIRYTDVDRNLKFDPAVDKREVILTGFNARNHDHSLHSVTAGPDGKFYFNNGNCGAVFTDNSGKTFYMGGTYDGGGGEYLVDHIAHSGKESDDGHVWTSGFTVRMNPDGTDCEITGHGYRNSYEQSLDSYGNTFQNDNDNPPACRVSYVLEYGNAGFFTRSARQSYREVQRPQQDHASAHWRQLDPGTMDAGDIYGGGSPTGVTMYENGALGKNFRGSFFSCEPGRNTIFHYKPEPQGATFALKRGTFTTTNPSDEFFGSDFVGGGRNMSEEDRYRFRPSDITVGPDGAVYVTDWFDGRVGGHADLDQSCSGTIYRIAPKGFKPEVPKLELKTIAGAIQALSSPAINTRYLGFVALKKQGAKALPALEELLKNENRFIAARAIWLLPHLGSEGQEKCLQLLTHSDPNFRIASYRALRRAGTSGDRLIRLARHNDPSPAVRREVSLAMRNLPGQDIKLHMVALARKLDTSDKNALEAFGLGAAGNENLIWRALKNDLKPGKPHQWDEHFARLTWRLWPSDAVADLKARAVHPSLTAEARSFAVESLGFIRHRKAADAMLELCDNPLTKDDATYWIFRNSMDEWNDFGLRDKLRTRGIYDPDKITIQEIRVPHPPEPKFTVQQVLSLKGDARNGATLMNRCLMCHEFNGQGINFGPNLKGWGSSQPRDVIARALVKPTADIAHGYKGTIFQLKDGRQVHGLSYSKSDPATVTSTGGVTQLIPRKFIRKQRRMKRSLMLSADQMGLTKQDVADLVAYLRQY